MHRKTLNFRKDAETVAINLSLDTGDPPRRSYLPCCPDPRVLAGIGYGNGA